MRTLGIVTRINNRLNKVEFDTVVKAMSIATVLCIVFIGMLAAGIKP